MLPGFRFLFAAIVLSMSLLVFGLGAAALFRAAHEEFASNPSWRAAPETRFAQQEAAPPPVLALLRVEPRASEQKTTETQAVGTPAELAATVSSPPEPASSATPPEAEKAASPTETTAALNPPASSNPQASASEAASAGTAQPAASKPDTQIAETPAQPPSQNQPASAQPDASADKRAATFEPQVAATERAPATKGVAAAPASEQTSGPAQPDPDPIATKIATLGGPAVTIETTEPAKAQDAKSERSLINKRLRAQRARQRRQLAARRALLARQAVAQQVANPFAQQPNLAPARTP